MNPGPMNNHDGFPNPAWVDVLLRISGAVYVSYAKLEVVWRPGLAPSRPVPIDGGVKTERLGSTSNFLKCPSLFCPLENNHCYTLPQFQTLPRWSDSRRKIGLYLNTNLEAAEYQESSNPQTNQQHQDGASYRIFEESRHRR